MTLPFSFGAIRIGARGDEDAPREQSEETPFRICVMGDFSGRASRGVREAKLGGLRPVLVDRDNLEEVMARLGVELQLAAGAAGGRLALRFRELDDFRPDRLFTQVEAFENIRELRRQLGNPATFAQAAGEVKGWTEPERAPAPAESEKREPAPAPPPEKLLEAILAQTPERVEAAPPIPGGVDWNAFLQKSVAASLVPREDPRQAELLAFVDAASGSLMRALLHQADFQALEANWRALAFLVRRLETDGQLKLYLLDISRAELATDLAAADDLGATGIYRLLVEQTVGTPGAQPWALVVGNYTFGPARADAELLGRLAKIAHGAGAPFLAAASPRLLGCASLADTPDPDDWKLPLDPQGQAAWAALRGLPEASYLGLVLPRFLLRLPYGKDTDPAEELAFEELPADSAHEFYLWGNPAVICAYLLGQAFIRHGWALRPGSVTDVEGLPFHIYTTAGESEAKPCAETLLSRRAVDKILDLGLMPLVSAQGRDSVHVPQFQALAGPLSGRW